jgi:2-polyprenyl-6-methoxyphenol hydroxylase-like FAD-dependent oxidoreductase
MPERAGRHVEIAGAGIAGLAAATAFARAGWSVRVHERGDQLREIGAGIFMWENGLRVLEAIGAYDAATAGGELDDYWEIRDERDRLLQSGWMMGGTRLYTILRSTLHQALAQAATAAGAEIVLSSRVTGASSDGRIFLENGEARQADLIVAADGVNSAVRDSLGLLKKIVDLEDGCGRYLIRRAPDDPVKRSLEFWKGGRRIGIVPASPEKVYIYLCCPAADIEGRRSPVNHQAWIESFPSLRGFIERVTDNGRWASFSDVTCHAWSKGRVAVIGDAAHAMSPNLGQGACVAMQSAFVLTQELNQAADVAAALARWEGRLRPMVDATQRFSRFYGRVGTKWPNALLDIRSALIWTIGRSKTLQRKINVAAHSDIMSATGSDAGGRSMSAV